jgi:hypothetical protein
VLTVAEQHGVGPLLYRHLRAAGVEIPESVQRQLQAVYIRHRRGNDVRLRALLEILDAFGAAGIESLVLKGPALMFLVYESAALRPISDLDILVPASAASRAQHLLRELGFHVPAGDRTLRHHLPAATKSVDGVGIQVEVHRDALARDHAASITLAAAREPLLQFELHGRAVSALGMHEMLWHVCEHLVGSLPRPLRLIWIADAIGFAERFEDRLDWQRIAREFPLVLNVLAFVDGLTPLSETLRRKVPDRCIMEQARGGEQALSWSPQEGVRAGGRWQQLRRTLHPPSWWIDLRYGGPRGGLNRMVRQLRYLEVFGRASRRRLSGEYGK